MKYVSMIVLAIAALQTNVVHGDLIFSVVPSSTQIALGSSANLSVFIQSRNDVPVTVGGYSLNVIAGPGNGTGGTFTAGTFNFLVGDPGQSWDLLTDSGKAFSTADTGNAGGTGVGNVLSTQQLLGTLTLSTVGATTGNYSITVDQLSAIQVNGNFISGGTNGATFAGPIAYTITAVPEPGSLLLLSSLGIAVGGWYRVRQRRNSSHKDV